MRRHLILGTVFSAALAVGVGAQSGGQSPTGQPPTGQPPTGQPPTGQDTKSSSSAAQTITVTGCLKADSSSPSAAPGAPAGAPASSASAGFILETSGSGAAATPASPTESPSPTATSGSSSSKTYKLSGSSSDIASLVGKKVEVKGTLQSRAGGASESSAMGDSSKAQQLRVTSVKEVPGSCSQ